MYGFYSFDQKSQPEHIKLTWNYKDGGFALNHDSSILEQDGVLVCCLGKHLQDLNSPDQFIDHESRLKLALGLFKQLGPSFAGQLDGDFLFIFYERDQQKLSIVNNRSQAHKLYYFKGPDYLAFADHLKTLKKMIPPPTIHLGSVLGFVSNGFTISDQTQLTDVKKLLPAFSIEASRSEFKLLEYWRQDFKFEKKSFGNIDDAIDLYENLYRSGIENFIEGHQTKDLGTLLSGGHDTSFCLIEAGQVFPKSLHTFTCTFPDWAFNEEDYARHISRKMGARFHAVPFLPSDLDQVITLIDNCQEPVVGSCLPLHILGRKAAQYVDTLLGGDGGDTLWGEYYPVQEYHRWIKNFPTPMRRAAHSLTKGLRDLTDWERFWELEHVSSLFVDDNYYDDFLRKLCTYRHFPDSLQREIFQAQVFENSIPKSSLEIAFTKDNFDRSLIEAKLYNGFFTYQSFSQYRTLEAHNLAVFFPTLSKPVVDFICSLPWNWVNGGTPLHRLTNNKTINRRFHKVALSRYLGRDEIYNRSFDMPWHSILKPRLAVLEKLLSALKRRGWFETKGLEKLFKEFKEQKVKDHELLELKHHGYRIYTLLVLEVWTRLYVDNLTGFDEQTRLEDFLS